MVIHLLHTSNFLLGRDLWCGVGVCCASPPMGWYSDLLREPDHLRAYRCPPVLTRAVGLERHYCAKV